MREGLNQGGAEGKEIYEISVLDATKLSIFQKLIRGGRVAFVVYAGKIFISISGLHTIITTHLGIQENTATYFHGTFQRIGSGKFCSIKKRENGHDEVGIEYEPEGINIENQLLVWFGLKS
jgi:hypothetical protein